MSDTIIHLWHSVNGGAENAAVNVDIPQDGVITGVQYAHSFELDADGEYGLVELSFISTLQANTNDSRGLITAQTARMSLTTSGVAVTSINGWVPMNLKVAGGERLYVNLLCSAGVGGAVRYMVHLEPGMNVTRRSQRRR